MQYNAVYAHNFFKKRKTDIWPIQQTSPTGSIEVNGLKKLTFTTSGDLSETHWICLAFIAAKRAALNC